MTATDPWIEFATRTIHPPAQVIRRRRLALLVIIGLWLVIAAAIHDGVITNEAPPTNSPDLLSNVSTCQEDEPCWDCHTMGNRICGPATTDPTNDTPEGR